MDNKLEKQARARNEQYLALAEEKYGEYSRGVEAYYNRHKNEKCPTTVKASIAACCENTQDYLKSMAYESGREDVMHMSTEQLLQSDLGTFVKHGFQLISALIPTSVLTDMVSVQPLDRDQGKVFFLDYVYKDNKGRISSADSIFDAKTGADVYDIYSMGRVRGETITATESGTQGGTNFQRFELTLPFTPLDGVDSFSFDDVDASADANGDITGSDVVAGTSASNTVQSDGSLDVAIDSSQIPGTVSEADVTFDYDLEDTTSNILDVSLDITSETVTPRFRALTTSWLLNSSFELRQHYGEDAEDLLTSAMAGLIRAEIDKFRIKELRDNAQSSSLSAFDTTTRSSISQNQRNEDFKNHIIDLMNEMEDNSGGRYHPDWAVAGSRVIGLVEGLNDFQPANVTSRDRQGPHVVGEWNGLKWIKARSIMSDTNFFVGHKGDNFVDAAAVWAPWIPVMVSEPYWKSKLQREKGLITSNAFHITNSQGFLSSSITV